MIPNAIETLSGRMFDYDLPMPDQVDINDIAVALGNTCRFGGHVTQFYSVAEHAVLVYRLVKDAGFEADVCYAALHHDSHEAYLGDIPTPLKNALKRDGSVWKDLELYANWAIAGAISVTVELFDHDAVKAADTMALEYEAAILKPSGKAQRHGAWRQVAANDVPPWAVQGMSPEDATIVFLACHKTARAELGSV